MSSEEFPIRESEVDMEPFGGSESSSQNIDSVDSNADPNSDSSEFDTLFEESASDHIDEEEANWPLQESLAEPDEAFLQNLFDAGTDQESARNDSNEADPLEQTRVPAGADFNQTTSAKIPLNLTSPTHPEPEEALPNRSIGDLEKRIAELRQQETELKQSIAALKDAHAQKLQEQMAESQTLLSRMVREGLTELERRKQELRLEIEQLERRQDRIRAEMRQTFAGVSQDLAIRVQGFKDYLVGSLQDLAAAAEQLEIAPRVEPVSATTQRPKPEGPSPAIATQTPKFTEDRFENNVRRIRGLLDQYRTRPDYYGPPWQLRRTFEPIHAERVANWFFEQGGRGALRTIGSRLQNILITSATISILKDLYGDRLRVLVLINSPERLGEWRRGLQDCLGISRTDFGSERGIVLFDDPEPLAQRADRLLKNNLLPFIILDESEDKISLSVLQFPLWLAFAPDPMMSPPNPPLY